MQQQAMFYETVDEVLVATVQAIGGYKAVGAALRGDKEPDAAATWLRNCLNPNKDERLNPEQVIQLVRIGREKGVHYYANYVAQTLGYTAPVPLTQEDLAQRAIAEGAQAMQTIVNLVATLKAQGVDLGALAAQAGSVRGGAL